MRPDESPAANLFGRLLGFTLNKRQSIEREKSGHTPVRKKHGHTMCRASSVRARVAIQEALAVKMSSLHFNDSLSRRVELPDNWQTMIVTPDGYEDDEQCIIDDSADDSYYDDATVANPTPKLFEIRRANQSKHLIVTSCASFDHTRSITNCSTGERRAFILLPRWNDSTLTIAGNFTLTFRQRGPLRNRSKHSTQLVLA